MNLLYTLFRRADIEAPVMAAQAYVQSRSVDAADLGDIFKLPYVTCVRDGRGVIVRDKDSYKPGDVAPKLYFMTEAEVRFGTEVEARAHILRRFW